MTSPVSEFAFLDLDLDDEEELTLPSVPEWLKWARCAEGDADPKLFDVPEAGQSPASVIEQLRAAWQFCSVCPVRAKCSEYGEELEAEGVWGGDLRSFVSEGRWRARKTREIVIILARYDSGAGYARAMGYRLPRNTELRSVFLAGVEARRAAHVLLPISHRVDVSV